MDVDHTTKFPVYGKWMMKNSSNFEMVIKWESEREGVVVRGTWCSLPIGYIFTDVEERLLRHPMMVKCGCVDILGIFHPEEPVNIHKEEDND